MILVTGSTGFIGSYLVRYLVSQGKTVRAMRRESSDLSLLGDCADKVEWVFADVLDIPSLEDAFRDVEYVYHSAAMISFNPAERGAMMKVNVEGTANIVNMALDVNVKKLVHVSSISALGRNPEGELINEESEWKENKYNTFYGLSKFLAEKEVWRGIAEGLPAVIVSPSQVLGAGKWSDTSLKIFERVANGVIFYTAGVNGYVDVRDVVKTMTMLMESDITEEKFIVSAENLPLKKVMDEIAAELGLRKPFIKVDGWLIPLAMIAENLKARLTMQVPLFTLEVARLASNKSYYDNNKIKKALNYEFIPVLKTIKESVKHLRESQVASRKFAILPLT